MTTIELTTKEHMALETLINVCLNNMGGETVSDLWDDFLTWVEPKDLVHPLGFDLAQARGLFSSMQVKELIQQDGKDWFLTETAVKLAEEIL